MSQYVYVVYLVERAYGRRKWILNELEEFICGRRLVAAENESMHSGGTTSEEAHKVGTRD